MSLVFPLPFDGDTPTVAVFDSSGNELDDSLDENTYATFGTIPKGGSSTLTLYVKNTGATPIYSVKCEGIASSHQLGTAVNTYEAVDLPQELGNIDPRETIELQVVWTVPTESPTGMKIFGLKVTDSTYLAISENHDYWTKLTITNNDTDLLTDFPIEIDLDVDSIDWSKTTSDGRDLRFYDENLNELSYYIETWTPATTTGKVWVRVPKLEGGETIDIYLGYGNFDSYSLSDLYAKYEVYEDFKERFSESGWVSLFSTYDFTSNYDCITITNTGNSYETTHTPTIYLPMPRVMKSFAVEFSGRGTLTISGIAGRPASAAIDLSNRITDRDMYLESSTSCPFHLGRSIGKSSAYYLTGHSYASGWSTTLRQFKIEYINKSQKVYYPPETLKATTYTETTVPLYLRLGAAHAGAGYSSSLVVDYIYIYQIPNVAPTIVFADVADITAEFTNPDVDSGIICVIGNVARQLAFHDYDFKKIIYEVGYNNAYWRVPGTSGGIYVWGKLEMRPLYGEDVSFVDNLYANDAYFYTFVDYTYDIHDKLDIEGVLYDIQAIQVHDAGSETIYKTLVLKRQPEYYACCTGTVS